MMKSELKYLLNIELEDGQLPESYVTFVEANIGLKGEKGSDIFSFHVVTPITLPNEISR